MTSEHRKICSRLKKQENLHNIHIVRFRFKFDIQCNESMKSQWPYVQRAHICQYIVHWLHIVEN